MERVELALKNSVTAGDDFSVDDLLDFSNDDVFVEDEAELKVQRKRGDGDNTLRRSNDVSTAGQEFGSLPASELAVPMDDLKELEWLSNFVDDSSTPYSAPTKKPVWLTGNRRHPVAPGKEESESCFKTPPPVKIRSKRPRTGASAWCIGSPTLTDSSSSSTTSSSSSSAPSSPPWLSGAELLDYPLVKRQKKMKPSLVISSNTQSQTRRCSNCGVQKMPQWRAGLLGANTLCNACPLVKRQKKMRPSLVISSNTQSQTRRCSHCGVQKTPQWRAGPLGAKTLCNACGVRFKSGRLLPEYRPACSPTFSSELHSNHHREVIEMRRKKETTDSDDTGLNPSVQAVPTF